MHMGEDINLSQKLLKLSLMPSNSIKSDRLK
jgi:hypothetical protein